MSFGLDDIQIKEDNRTPYSLNDAHPTIKLGEQGERPLPFNSSISSILKSNVGTYEHRRRTVSFSDDLPHAVAVRS